jgi:hypothetical protein
MRPMNWPGGGQTMCRKHPSISPQRGPLGPFGVSGDQR